MLFMMICSWEPGEEREVRTRSVTWKWPEDVKVVSEYYDLQEGAPSMWSTPMPRDS